MNTLMPANAGYISLCSLYHCTLYNPYLDQLCAQTGMTEYEARRECRLSANPITDAQARDRGYATAQDYLDALHEFLNSN